MENNEQIQPNDMVIVYKPCRYCGATDTIGYVFKVEDIKHWEDSQLECCSSEIDKDFAVDATDGIGYTLWCLKKLPPIEDLDNVDRKEDLPLLETIR